MAKMMAAYLRRVKIAPDLGACGRCYVLPTRSQRRNCSVERDPPSRIKLHRLKPG